MKNVFNAILIAVIVGYVIGDFELWKVSIFVGFYLIVYSVVNSTAYMAYYRERQKKQDDRIAVFLMKRKVKRQLKDDAKKVKDILNKEIK